MQVIDPVVAEFRWRRQLSGLQLLIGKYVQRQGFV